MTGYPALFGKNSFHASVVYSAQTSTIGLHVFDVSGYSLVTYGLRPFYITSLLMHFENSSRGTIWLSQEVSAAV